MFWRSADEEGCGSQQQGLTWRQLEAISGNNSDEAEGVSYYWPSLGLHLLLTGICLLNHITLSLQETQADMRKEISRAIPFLRQKLNYNWQQSISIVGLDLTMLQLLVWSWSKGISHWISVTNCESQCDVITSVSVCKSGTSIVVLRGVVQMYTSVCKRHKLWV